MNKSPCSSRCWPSGHAAGKRPLQHGIFFSVFSNPQGVYKQPAVPSGAAHYPAGTRGDIQAVTGRFNPCRDAQKGVLQGLSFRGPGSSGCDVAWAKLIFSWYASGLCVLVPLRQGFTALMPCGMGSGWAYFTCALVAWPPARGRVCQNSSHCYAGPSWDGFG